MASVSDVVKLHRAATDQEPVLLPPHDITITVNLSGERQIIVRSPVTAPITPAESHQRTDALMWVAERQRSLIEIRVLTEDLASKRAALDSVWSKREAEAKEKHEAALAKLTDDITRVEGKREQLEQNFINAERARGKQGDIRLVGNAKNRDDALSRDVAALRDKAKTLEAEHLQNLAVITGNVEKLQQEIAAMERLLKKHQEIVG